jgi:hypothetical protein
MASQTDIARGAFSKRLQSRGCHDRPCCQQTDCQSKQTSAKNQEHAPQKTVVMPRFVCAHCILLAVAIKLMKYSINLYSGWIQLADASELSSLPDRPTVWHKNDPDCPK